MLRVVRENPTLSIAWEFSCARRAKPFELLARADPSPGPPQYFPRAFERPALSYGQHAGLCCIPAYGLVEETGRCPSAGVVEDS